MNSIVKVALMGIGAVVLFSGCAQKMQIKALAPAEVGAMASKRVVAINSFKDDKVGLSSKIESQIAKHKLDNKKYFTVVNRKDMAKVVAEQKLQSSELMDESTTSKIGKLVGAQVVIAGDITSADAVADKYVEDREKCIQRYKNGDCAKIKNYKVTCKTIQANVSANINIIDVETASIIHGDSITKEYSADTCKAGQTNLGLFVLDTGPKQILSKSQALGRLTDAIASEFVYKLTPSYIYFTVVLLDSIELKDVTDKQKLALENSLKYIKNNRMDKANKILSKLFTDLNEKSYVVSYVLGVTYEAQGKLEKAQKLYNMADELTTEPVKEINVAINRIALTIAKKDEAIKQMNAS